MDRRLILGYLIIFVILFFLISFVQMSLNPFAWHWVSRLILVVSFIAITVYFDLKK